MARPLSFAAQIDEWVKKTSQRMEAVVKTAAQNVGEEVISRTPVDTGFLRASFTATLNSIPPRLRELPKRDQTYPAPDINLVIEGAKLGDTIYMTFGASYARYVEYGTRNQFPAAMVRLSARNWPFHVQQAIREAKAAVASRS
jgi:bacteriophage HK97-gp10 putative tail-component